jgi:hypothetical protein
MKMINRRLVLISVMGLVGIAGLVSVLPNAKDTKEPESKSVFCDGLAAYEKGERATAERIWTKKLQESSNADGPTALWLGTLMKEEKRFDESEKLLKQALTANRVEFGADSLETTLAMRQLAEVYASQGKVDASAVLLKRVIQICAKLQGPADVQTMLARNDLAQVYLLEKKPALAKSILVESLKACETKLGKSHPSTQSVRLKLANLANPPQ